MKTTSLSMRDFISLFPTYASTVKHFINSRGKKVMSGKAELFPEGPGVYYTHDLFTCLFTILYQDIVLYQEEAYTLKEINAAFEKASQEFFLSTFFPRNYEEVSFMETDKGKRCKNYGTSKKAIKDNDRGQKERRKMRRAMKLGADGVICRFRGRQIRTVLAEELERNDSYEFSTPAYNSGRLHNPTSEDSNYLFLAEGMNVLIESDGTVGALSFNSNYLGCRIIRAA